MECPHCHSDDITRSRKRLYERLVLPLLQGRVLRCRDCKTRFWTEVKWAPVCVGFLTMAVTAGVFATVVAAHQMRTAEMTAAAQQAQLQAQRYRVRQRVQQFPVGLPPLSSVPRPVSERPSSGK